MGRGRQNAADEPVGDRFRWFLRILFHSGWGPVRAREVLDNAPSVSYTTLAARQGGVELRPTGLTHGVARPDARIRCYPDGFGLRTRDFQDGLLVS